jgi:hypothetical protein
MPASIAWLRGLAGGFFQGRSFACRENLTADDLLRRRVVDDKKKLSVLAFDFT